MIMWEELKISGGECTVRSRESHNSLH